MAELKIQTFLKKITKVTTNDKVDEKNTKYKSKSYSKLSLVTKQEFENIRNAFFIPISQNRNNKIDLNSNELSNYFSKIFDQISTSKLSYEKLTTLEPKIEQAETIIIPSILSPNSLKSYDINFTLSSSIDSIIEKNNDLFKLIINKINTFTNDELEINSKLTKWIKEALFSIGAKPILILPTKIVSNIRNTSISFEDYKEQYRSNDLVISQEQIFSSVEKNINDKEFLYTESIEELSNNIKDSFKKIKKIKDIELDNFLLNGIKTISIEAQKVIEITDKIETIGENKKKEIISNKNFLKKYDEWYNNPNQNVKVKKNDFLDLTDFLVDINSNTIDHPILIELPAESVIPITNDNNPIEHLGYIIALDNNGQPISTNSNVDQDMTNPNDRQTIDLINKIHNSGNNKSAPSSYYFSNKLTTTQNNTILQKLYDVYIDNLLKTTAKNIGFLNVNFNLKSTIIKTMFSRLLKKKNTKLLFIPKFMLTYITFKYNEYGVGVSKINELSFILSLKLTYLISRLYKMVNQSIDHKDVKISLDKNINQPLEFLQSLKEVLIQNKMLNFSYDPIKIVKALADKHISIMPNNIPGIENFDISSDNNQVSTNMPDDSLGETLDKMLTILLEVPPSAYNELSENEYARSLTTINILFDLKMQKKRTILTEHISSLIQNYFTFDNKFQQELNDILSKKLKTKNNNKLILNIIKSIKLSLPESNISYDEAEFELANKYIDFVDKLISSVYPKELISNRDNQDFFESLTTTIKADLVKKYLSKSNLMLHFDKIFENLEDFNIEDLINNESIVSNYKKAIDSYHEKVAKTKEDNSGY